MNNEKIKRTDNMMTDENVELINHNPRFTAVNYNILAADDLTAEAKVLAMILIDKDMYSVQFDLHDLINFMGVKHDGNKFTIKDLKNTMKEIVNHDCNFFKNFKCVNLYNEVFAYDN